MAMSAIAAAIDRDRSTVTTLEEKPRDRGCVATRSSEQDRRATVVTLTRKGQRIRSDFAAVSAAIYATAYRGVPARDRDVFVGVLKKLYANFEHR
jgi:DNA-binding MarR family transcriptional regulator